MYKLYTILQSKKCTFLQLFSFGIQHGRLDLSEYQTQTMHLQFSTKMRIPDLPRCRISAYRRNAHSCSQLLLAVHSCSLLLTAVHGCARLLTAAHSYLQLFMAAYIC